MITNKRDMLDRFWDTFVIDALIGNKDRHLGNFGLLEKADGSLHPAPVYDCGASLSAWLTDVDMETRLNTPLFKNQEYGTLKSCYRHQSKRVIYQEIFRNPPDQLAKATLRIAPRIDIGKINAIIKNTPTMASVRKEYLRRSVFLRNSQIIQPLYVREVKKHGRAAH